MGETVRFGVSLDSDLLEKFDALCERQGCPSRSEALRDIIRDALVQDSLLSVGVAGWLLLNYANVDALVARYNIGRGLDTGAVLSASDGRLGALPALEELLEAQPEETELRQAVETLRDSARWQAAHWQTWSVAAWRGQ